MYRGVTINFSFISRLLYFFTRNFDKKTELVVNIKKPLSRSNIGFCGDLYRLRTSLLLMQTLGLTKKQLK